jgi:DNA-binding transcriptional LysR family regulator
LRSLERKVGGRLVFRTSRHVELTALGTRLRKRLVPVHAALLEALDEVKNAARNPMGPLRIGFTVTTLEKVTELAGAFEALYRDCEIELREVSIVDPYGPLRRGKVDVLVNWLPVDEPDLTVGPVLDRMDRVLAVAATHPLAERTSVSIEEVADYQVRANPPGIPEPMYEAIIPSRTKLDSLHEILAEVVRGEIVHPTVNVPPFRGPANVVLVPLHDLPPLALALIWPTERQTTAVRALARLAAADGAASDSRGS